MFSNALLNIVFNDVDSNIKEQSNEWFSIENRDKENLQRQCWLQLDNFHDAYVFVVRYDDFTIWSSCEIVSEQTVRIEDKIFFFVFARFVHCSDRTLFVIWSIDVVVWVCALTDISFEIEWFWLRLIMMIILRDINQFDWRLKTKDEHIYSRMRTYFENFVEYNLIHNVDEKK